MRHRISLCALALTTVAVTATGCGGSGSGAPDASPSPSPGTTSPEDLCATIITRWAGRIYDTGDSTYGDYQSMGLSNGQYLILREVLDAARVERRRESVGAGRKLITRQARERCAERYRDGGPSTGPWT
ncbi:hypothetical protein [Streptomyces sp. NPDC047123]|uniref:hypothetical protein n=1 Tax=Streptomyces sp. NPDC047123 TaxID=3155622 RepID=UPI0033D7D97E